MGVMGGNEATPRPAVRISFSYPERYFDGDAQAFRYRQRRYETWWERGQKYGRWEWVPAMWNGNWAA